MAMDKPNPRPFWKHAGYPLCDCHNDMASAMAAYPPTNPDYVRMYNLTSARYAIRNIFHSRLKVSLLNQLNDPFELLGKTHRQGDGTHEPTLQLIERATKEFGLLCFCSDWQSSALWGHYGDKHKGICLGFDVKKSDLIKVCYRNKRAEALAGGKSLRTDEAEIRERLSIKSFDWKYEHEWRRIIRLPEAVCKMELYFVPFDENLKLAEVILGVRCDCSLEKMRQRIERLHPDVRVFKARVAKQHFSIVPDEKTVIW